MYPDQGGAGGNWPVIDEIVDPFAIQQQGDLSCGVACGQMLLQDRQINITPGDIENLTKIPVSSQELANVLNILDSDPSRLWEGGPLRLPGATESQLVNVLNTTGSWAAMLWETGAGIGHFVIVDGTDEDGSVLIRDPWQGTSYKMIKENFCNYWTAEAIFVRQQ